MLIYFCYLFRDISFLLIYWMLLILITVLTCGFYSSLWGKMAYVKLSACKAIIWPCTQFPALKNQCEEEQYSYFSLFTMIFTFKARPCWLLQLLKTLFL